MAKSDHRRAMDIESVQWVDMLMAGASQLNLNLSSDQTSQFQGHAQLLMQWNRKINLTAIADPVGIAVKHFLDSVAPLAHLSLSGEVLDLGTGGGFPGIPLKIMRPEVTMTLIDGTRKKINFVKQVIRQLDLDKIEALHQRAETMGALNQYACRYKSVISRAVSDLKDVVRLAMPLLANGGKIVIYKGPDEKIPEKLFLTPKGIKPGDEVVFQTRVISYKLPITGDQRRVVVLDMLTN